MINFSQISSQSVLGKLLRAILRLVPAGTTMKILQGPMRGRKWISDSATNGCWLGTYESDKQQAIVERLRQGQVFFDVGANVGFYTLLAAGCVGESGKVVSFEPFPNNIGFLKRHVDLNRLANVQVIEAAVGETGGQARFKSGDDGHTGRLGTDGDLKVEVVVLDQLLQGGDLPVPDVIKIDVEGAELQVLQGGAELLRDYRPDIFLATHGRQVKQDCLEFLESLGYRCLPLGDPKEVEQADEFLATGV